MELDIFDEINLFEDVEQENEKYINAIEALELMAYKTNNSITNVARRLLLDEFNKTAYMFKLNEFEKIELYCSEKGFDGGYVITTEFLKLAISTLGTFDYVETDIYGNEYEYSQADWFDYYWLKSDYFQCVARFGVAETDIKKLKAFEAMRSFQFIQERQIEAEQSEQDQRLKADFKVISEIFMDEVKEFDEKELQQTDPNIESLNAEIARLKQEMVSKDQTIAELQQKNGSLVAENAINDIEISLKNSELLFIAVLLKKLQSAITTKRHKSQNAILQSIENEYGVGSGLSKSTTDKIMKKANGIYKSLITNKMQ